MPGGTLSSSGLVGIMVPDVSAELPSLIGPVKTLGALSLSDSAGPMGPTGMLSSSVVECASPVGPIGTLLPCDGETGLFPIVPTGELSSVEAVPFFRARGIRLLHNRLLKCWWRTAVMS